MRNDGRASRPEPEPLASDDARVVDLWLLGLREHTRTPYRRSAERFLQWAGRPLSAMTPGDVESFAQTLADLAPTTRTRSLAAARSLLRFAHTLGLLDAEDAPLGQQTLPTLVIDRVIAAEPSRRNRAILRLVFVAGLRVAEICSLVWDDLLPRGLAGEARVRGRRGRLRIVPLPRPVWDELELLRRGATGTEPVFGGAAGALTDRQVRRIVKQAVRRLPDSAASTITSADRAAGPGHAGRASERGDRVRTAEAPRILVVDDDPDIRILLTTALADEGYRVEEARNGEAALSLARSWAPELILMDLMLPVRDGVEATRLLKADPMTREIRVIAMSAGGTLRGAVEHLESDALLAKPFDLDTLLAEIAFQLRYGPSAN